MLAETTGESLNPVLLAVGILVVGIPLLKILIQPVLKNDPPTLTFANVRQLYQSSAQRLLRKGFQKVRRIANSQNEVVLKDAVS